MPLLRLVLYAVLFVFILRIIIRFVFPIVNATRIVRKQMDQMRDAGRQPNAPSAPPKPQPKDRGGEYIDYEEVKD